jgi:single-strand DNA-binding protein
VTVFGAAAESVSRYMRKGSRVALDGRLEWREWETADQQKRQAVSVVADTVQFLDSPAGARLQDEPGDGSDASEGQDDGELVGAAPGAEQEDLVF